MPDKELSLKLNDDDVKRKLQEDIALAEKLEEALKRAASAMSSTGQGQPGQGGPTQTASAGRASGNLSATASAAAPPPQNSAAQAFAMQSAALRPSGIFTAAGTQWMGSGGGAAVVPYPIMSSGVSTALGGGMSSMSGPMSGMGFSPTMGGMGGMMAGFGIARQVASSLMDYGTSQINMQSQRLLTGGADIMGQSGALFRAAGSMIGLGGPAEAVGRWIAAPAMGAASASMAMVPFMAAYAGGNAPAQIDAITGRTMSTPSQLQRLTDAINDGRGGSKFVINTNPMFAGLDQVGRASASIMGGLFAGGINPFSGGSVSPATDVYGSYRAGFDRMGQSGRMIDTLAGVAGTAIVNAHRSPGGESEAMWRTITRRVGRMVGNDVDDVMQKVISPIYGSLPETGNNIADIMTRFGPESTLTYLRSTNDALTSAVDPMVLSATSANIRTGQRLQQLGSLQIRGSGAAQARGLAGQMVDISSLPGGADSMAFAQAKNSYASAYLQAGQQSDIVNFGIPGVQIQGQMTRAQLMPYAPSRMFELSARQVQNNMGQIGVLKSRMETMQSAGTLSEEAQLQMTQQIEGLRNQNASNFAMMSEGRENLIPGLVAGHRRTVGATDSLQLAAMSYNRGGVPFRNAGAMNGQQLAMQNAYADMIGLGEGEIFPRSRTQAMNNGGMGGGGGTGNIEALLSQILQALQRYGGPIQGSRNSGPIGQGYGALETRNIGQGNNSISRGGYD